jgi:ABC-2 type transport system permease protein
MTGLGILLRLALRRDRVMIPAWVGGLGLAVLVTASSYVDLYATESSRRDVVQTLGRTPATLALYGRIYTDSVGGLVAWRLGGIALALAGLMAILLVTRHTRAEEETGRAELVGSGAVGRHAPLAAALITAAIASVALGVIVTLAVVSTGLAADGALALGLVYTVTALAFAGIAAVTAQLTESARAANGLAVAVLGASFAIRAIGDAGSHWLSWLSPLGWGQAVRAYADERWWLLLGPAVLAVGAVALAVRLKADRDIAAGVLPPRPGPARGALTRPAQLAWRLQRGAFFGWAAGFAILGAAFGSIANDIGDVIGDSPEVREALQKLGGQSSLVDAYLSATLQILALVAAAYTIQATLRLRAEETSGRAEPLLATATSRTSWALSHALIALGGTIGLMLVTGVAAGIGHAAQTGDASEFFRVLGIALLQAPAAWVLGALTLLLFGALPRAVAAAWGALALCLALGQLGPVADLPQSLVDASPFAHGPVLGDGPGLAPLVLTLIALALAALGFAALNRRDLTPG